MPGAGAGANRFVVFVGARGTVVVLTTDVATASTVSKVHVSSSARTPAAAAARAARPKLYFIFAN